jgi:hypothetical protein
MGHGCARNPPQQRRQVFDRRSRWVCSWARDPAAAIQASPRASRTASSGVIVSAVSLAALFPTRTRNRSCNRSPQYPPRTQRGRAAMSSYPLAVASSQCPPINTDFYSFTTARYGGCNSRTARILRIAILPPRRMRYSGRVGIALSCQLPRENHFTKGGGNRLIGWWTRRTTNADATVFPGPNG